MELMKASAGSGKTFNLARKYITLLFKKQDRYAYKHILAVTFTNKATDEMKSRIMKELFILSTAPEQSGYLKYFMPSMFPASETAEIDPDDFITELPGRKGLPVTLDSLSECATDMLCSILHDYSAFSVSTIDRFFQQTLRAFSREIGQFASYQVELDKDSLVSESVDRVLDSLDENDTLKLKWLTDSVMEQIEQDGKYNLESSLVYIASRLKSDEHRALVEKFGVDEEKIYSRERLAEIKKSCRRTIREFADAVKSSAEEILRLLADAGVRPEDFKNGFMKILYGYAELGPGDCIEAPTAAFMARASDHEQWFAKAKAGKLLPSVYPLLEAPLEDFCSLFGEKFRIYRTALILDGQLYGLGVTADLYREFGALMKEKNVLSIDDSNTILKDIIDGSDAPFIYEKTGTRYENFLLDEFQDTSRIQWDNFRPLLQNSEAQGFDNLLVGDVKQSIYRWRGSDWNLLDSEVQNEFPKAKEKNLDTNYRSCRNIVNFNNSFFPYAADILDGQYGPQSGRKVSEIYSDVMQRLPDNRTEDGEVSLMFCPREEEPGKVLETVRMLRKRNIPFRDITVLVRNNVSGAVIATYLIENDVPVLTDDSLKVKSSVTVRRLCSLLSLADNPADRVNGYLAGTLDISVPENCHSLTDMCEALLRGLRQADPQLFDSEVLYVQSFMDALQDYVSINGNSLHDFLKSWSEADPAISSPSSGDSLRVMTIHKAKGLDFKYVIFPYVETVNLFKAGNRWCRPEFSGTPLESASDGLYDVKLSSKSDKTLFADDYRTELKMQYVDNINAIYVALTRAVKGMYLIAKLPSESIRDGSGAGYAGPFSDFSQILYCFSVRRSGQEATDVPDGPGDGMPDRCPKLYFSEEDDGTIVYSTDFRTDAGQPVAENGAERAGEVKPAVRSVPSAYPSWPLNLQGSDRLKFRTDSLDFFSRDGLVGAGASDRLRGIVLHGILSRVEVPSDLRRAVDESVRSGELSPEEGERAYGMLSERIASAAKNGWFGAGRNYASVLREVTLMDTDGSLCRPDRVIRQKDGGIMIVDYKFARREPASDRRYMRQVAGYADIFRRMGYKSVKTAVWYVPDDEVVWG